MPFVNPQCGPIEVEGAEKGDVLCVHIEFDRTARTAAESVPPRSFRIGGLVSNSGNRDA